MELNIEKIVESAVLDVKTYYENELKKRDAHIVKLKEALSYAYRLNLNTVKTYDRIIASTAPDDFDTRIEFLNKKIGLIEANCNLATAVQKFECDDCMRRW